jgi:hypothetical protein
MGEGDGRPRSEEPFQTVELLRRMRESMVLGTVQDGREKPSQTVDSWLHRVTQCYFVIGLRERLKEQRKLATAEGPAPSAKLP